MKEQITVTGTVDSGYGMSSILFVIPVFRHPQPMAVLRSGW